MVNAVILFDTIADQCTQIIRRHVIVYIWLGLRHLKCRPIIMSFVHLDLQDMLCCINTDEECYAVNKFNAF